MTAAIELSGVGVAVEGRTILVGVDLTVPSGQTVAVLGPSGSGKSTLLRVVLGLESPQSGEVRVQGQLVARSGALLVPVEERRLAMVFQDLALWPHLTVGQNLAFGLDAHGVPVDEQRRRIDAMLERVHLTDKSTRFPGQLSGGERQRVAIARALVMDPVAVLLDEPLANLDARLKRTLLGEFRTLIRERHAAALYVTHDLREAVALADRLVVLDGGRVVQQGATREVIAAPATDFVRELVQDRPADAGGEDAGS